MSNRVLKLFAVASLTAAIAACSSPVKLDENAANKSSTDLSSGSKGIPTVDASGDPLNDPNGVLAQRSVYFDFDSYVVKDQYRPVVENHARYLVSHPARHVAVEGNTDDVGSSEYNLALGQRRSEAVRKQLVLLGVKDDQVEAVSFGKEKLVATGTDEASRSKNRRADISYR